MGIITLLKKKGQSMSHIHHFDIEDANRYGIEQAIFLNYFRVGLRENKAHNTHIHDNYVWVNYTEHALSILFPYINIEKTNQILQNMVNNGLLRSGNYSKNNNLYSKWFSTEEFCLFNHINNSTSPSTSSTNRPNESFYYIEPSQSPRNENNLSTHLYQNNNANNNATNIVNNNVSNNISHRHAINEELNQPQRSWSEIELCAYDVDIDKLKIQHGYDKSFYTDILDTFLAKMEAEQVPAPNIVIARRRFVAYAKMTMLNFKQGNHRYNFTTDRKEQSRQNQIDKWQKYLGNPDSKIIINMDLRGLETPIERVWDSYIAKGFEKEIPLKNIQQLEAGFKNYLATWIKNETKVKYKPTNRASIDLDDRSWADNLILKD
ncbi:MAG: hypothetical protein ACI9LM_004079 [Alteromonadaceae bacterium]|jgi:hypothetical protein